MTGDSSMQQDQYVLAREVLLDALEVLRPHLESITLVGAQAIYVWVGESSDINIPPYTTDADLALNPQTLSSEPEILKALQAGGFERLQDPGIWKSARNDVTVDLLVPETLGGGGRRAARLSGHGKNTARKVQGLDSALIDREKKLITALESSDRRSFDTYVAGPAALLIAKLYKLWDRKDASAREDAKDALDLFRILRVCPTADLAERIALLMKDPFSQAETRQALAYLDELFQNENAHGAQMVGEAVGVLAEREEVISSSVFLAHDLIAATKE